MSELDASLINDRTEFQRNWVHGLRNPSGLQLQFHLDGERVVTEWTASDDHVGFPGFVHGGLISCVLDDAMGRSTLLYKRWVVTGRLSIRYRNGAPINTPLRIEGWVARHERRLITAEGRMVLPDGAVVADAEATYVPVPAGMMGEMLEAWPGFAEYVTEEDR